ncbi:MAG: LPS export ABC transporter periplasmic protein LptC [Nitrospirae bacterium]|nr:LPS export ABC transporter periplasmic protein LptC [Nitrospirota bacterium]
MRKVPLVVITVVALSLYFLIVRDDKVKMPGLKQAGGSFLEGIRIVHTKDGNKDWTLTAKRADLKGKGTIAELSDIEVTISDKETSIIADSGVYDMAGKKLTINGPIRAKEKDYTITAENIEFENSTGILKSDRAVRLEGRKFTLTGTGLNADNNQRKVRILKDVKATFNN